MASAEDAVEAIADLEATELNLAETAIAVIGEGDGGKGVDLAQAQEMEKVIEQSMPDSPVASDAVMEQAAETVNVVMDAPVDPPAPSQQIADAVPDAVEAVADEASAASAQTVPDTATAAMPVAAQEQAQSSPPVSTTITPERAEIVEPTNSVIAAPVVEAQLATDAAVPSLAQGAVPSPAQAAVPSPAQAAFLPLDQSTTGTPVPEAKAETSDQLGFPPGITEQSLSVRNNPDLVRAWRADPSNPKPLYALFDAAVTSSEITEARAWFELFSASSPTAMAPLLQLINLELAHSEFARVEALFGKALRGPAAGLGACPGVDVWKSYLHYIRRQNPIPPAGSPNIDTVRSTIRKAYEFALRDCGEDRESGDIWKEYIVFLGEGESTNSWDVQQRMDNVRKAYQKALCIPLNNVEQLWKDYDAFENGLNKLTAKKFLAERSPAYMTARGALRELKTITEGLSYPIVTSKPTWHDSDRAAVAAWKKYLKYEEGNPLVYSEPSALSGRISYALRKCLTYMRFFPELWHYAAHYYQQNGREEDAGTLLKEGADANPGSFLLTFAYAENAEGRKEFPACHLAFERLIANLHTQIEDVNVSVKDESERMMGPEINPAVVPPASGPEEEEQRAAELQRLIDERLARGQPVIVRRQKEVDDLMTAVSMVWIMYMRFARRAEGIKVARAVFSKARKSPFVSWQVFEASALMEYHSNKDAAVAIRIFKLGLQLFSEDVPYILRYLNFLITINDDQNSRALFEQFAVSLPADKARPLWDAWARYEYLYGDLSAVLKLEARFEETFPKDAPLKRFAQRYTYMGVDEIALRDLGFGIRPPQAPAPQPPIQARPQPRRPDSPPPRRTPPMRNPSPIRPRESYHERSPVSRQEPAFKRRAVSPPPQTRRFPPEKRWNGPRERSPPPMPAPRQERAPPPPMPMPDRGGLTPALNWFIGILPNNRSFDGPVFRPDDIMGLFDANPGIAGGPPPRPVYHDSGMDVGYRGPPPPRGRNW